MDEHGIDVDRIAGRVERLGLVTPDLQGCDEEDDAEEIVVIISVHGGLIQDVGARECDISRLRVIVVDHDNFETTDGESGAYAENVTDLQAWSRDEDAALIRAAGELPEAVRQELGLSTADSLPSDFPYPK